ncbi:MAG: sigma-70 family RNA polymerase sigma factor [Acidiferrobacterales bacterium]
MPEGFVTLLDMDAPKSRVDVSDESQLVARLRVGDGASYEQLVRTYGGRMLAVARRLVRNEEDARDCVQEAFLQAFRNIEKFEQRASLGSWLHRIVVNAALMKLRARARRPEESIEDLLPQFDADGQRTGPEAELAVSLELLERREVREAVRRSIDQLPDGYRNVLLIRDIEGYDTEETAALLGLTPGAVKTRLHRARTALKSLLAPVIRGGKP